MQINLELLKNLSDSEKITLWNEYQREISSNDLIYENEESFFEEYFSSAIEAVKAVHFGSYNYNDTYVSFDGYDNLNSFDNVDDEITFSELAEWLQENPDNYQDYDIWEEEEEEEDEEEE